MKLGNTILLTLSFLTVLSAQDIHLFSQPKSNSVTYETVSDAFTQAGFTVTSVSKLEKPFKEKFNDTRYDKYKVIALINKEIGEQLIKENPDAGVFLPFSLALHSQKDAEIVNLAFLDSKIMQKVTGIKNDSLYNELTKQTIAATSALGFNTEKQWKPSYSPLKQEGDLLYKKTITPSQNAQATADALVQKFVDHKFKVVNVLDVTSEIASVKEAYEHYSVLSICKKKVLNLASKTRSEAAVFAPCSMVLYQKKGSDTMTIAFPSTYNWLSTLAFTDEAAISILREEQQVIEQMISTLK